MECVRRGKKRSFHLKIGKIRIIFFLSTVGNYKNFKSVFNHFFRF